MSGTETTPLFADRIIGARIVDVTQQGPTAGLWKVEFAHKGTDDDSGFLIVALGSIYFNDGFGDV